MKQILRPVGLAAEWSGKRAPCDLFNGRGMLLVKAGAEIQLREHDHAGPLRVFCLAEEAARISDFDALAELRRVGAGLEGIDARLGCGETVAPGELARLARDLHAAWVVDADACLGYARLRKFGRPSVCHVVHAALIAAELAAASRIEAERIVDIVGGALTMNLAKLPLHDTMHAAAERPGEAMVAEIHGHPTASLELLERIGRFGKAWTDAVGGHHENVDGSGYPARLKGAEIALPARIVRVADTFAARLTGRKTRHPLHWNLRRTHGPLHMAQHLFGDDLMRLDRALTSQLMSAAGRFPPGSLVRLASNELAVIARRREGHPSVPHDLFAVRDGHHHPLDPPRRRHLGSGSHEIRNYANEEAGRLPSYRWERIWGYDA